MGNGDLQLFLLQGMLKIDDNLEEIIHRHLPHRQNESLQILPASQKLGNNLCQPPIVTQMSPLAMVNSGSLILSSSRTGFRIKGSHMTADKGCDFYTVVHC